MKWKERLIGAAILAVAVVAVVGVLVVSSKDVAGAQADALGASASAVEVLIRGQLRASADAAKALGLDPRQILSLGSRDVGNVVSDDGTTVDISGQFVSAVAEAVVTDAAGDTTGGSVRIQTALRHTAFHMSKAGALYMMGLSPKLSEITCNLEDDIGGGQGVGCAYTMEDGGIVSTYFDSVEVASWSATEVEGPEPEVAEVVIAPKVTPKATSTTSRE